VIPIHPGPPRIDPTVRPALGLEPGIAPVRPKEPGKGLVEMDQGLLERLGRHLSEPRPFLLGAGEAFLQPKVGQLLALSPTRLKTNHTSKLAVQQCGLLFGLIETIAIGFQQSYRPSPVSITWICTAFAALSPLAWALGRMLVTATRNVGDNMHAGQCQGYLGVPTSLSKIPITVISKAKNSPKIHLPYDSRAVILVDNTATS
jgi:hypothetical protein